MKTYRNSIVRIPTLLICYCLIAFLGGGVSSNYELFPVFNWSLFSDVTDTRVLCEIEVLSIDGVELDSPTRFYDLRDEFEAARSRDVTVLKLLQRICGAKLARREDTFNDLRVVLESGYLRERSNVIYRLVLQTYNPIERWRDGSLISAVVLGQYRTGDALN